MQMCEMAAELTQLPWERDVFTRLAARWRDLACAAEDDAAAEDQPDNAYVTAPPIAPAEGSARAAAARRRTRP